VPPLAKLDYTPLVRQMLLAMPPRRATAFIDFFESIAACEGDHPGSWPSSVPHLWITEFDGRAIRYSRAPGSGPRGIKVSAIF
jgi:hypothetical protein